MPCCHHQRRKQKVKFIFNSQFWVVLVSTPVYFRWAPVEGKCPLGTRFTGTHCEQMLPCQSGSEARQPRWCELPPFSFCGGWRQERQEEEAGCCLSSKLDPGSQTESSKLDPGSGQAEGQQTDEHIEPESEPSPEPEAEPNLDDEVEHEKSPTLHENAGLEDITTVKSISGQASDIFEETESKLETNLRPHRNLKNFKISVEMSEENKVVFKVPKEDDDDIAQEISEVFNTLPEEDEILLEINKEKTEANVNSLTVKNLQELEALVVRNMKNIVQSQQDTKLS